MAMGLTACPRADWIELDQHYPAEMAERRHLLATRRDDVFAAVSGSEPARQETWDVLSAHLADRWPDWFANDGSVLENRLTGDRWNLAELGHDPLEAAALLVQEDLCIIQMSETGPLLAAGVVCFPSRWRLGEKIGRPLAAVHAPVPFYGDRLARPVDRFMGVVKPGHVAVRLNWSMSDDPTLFQPGGKWRADRAEHITANTAGDALFVRVERQTLTRLPQCGAVLFTIRVHVYPLARIVARPQIAQRLAEAVRALPPETLHYKSLLRFRDALLDYLGRVSQA
jgi:dimethylamine monooxygenase subunit A